MVTAIKSSLKENFVLDNKTEIVAYSVLGEPLNEKLYNKKLDRAEDDYKNGRFITTSNLKKKYNLA